MLWALQLIEIKNNVSEETAMEDNGISEKERQSRGLEGKNEKSHAVKQLKWSEKYTQSEWTHTLGKIDKQTKFSVEQTFTNKWQLLA